MPLAKVLSCAVLGLEGELVEVEVDVGKGKVTFQVVGLGDTAVQEARERVHSAIKNSGFQFPSNASSSTWRRQTCARKGRRTICR
jgi:magnesium chelatase family protein